MAHAASDTQVVSAALRLDDAALVSELAGALRLRRRPHADLPDLADGCVRATAHHHTLEPARAAMRRSSARCPSRAFRPVRVRESQVRVRE